MQRIENWTRIYDELSDADREKALGSGELEKLALAAYLIGKDDQSFRFLERAHHGYLDQQKIDKAVRSAFWLGLMFMNAGERVRSSGWFARGERLLGNRSNGDCPEKGLLLIPKALGELYAGHGARAQQLFGQVAAAGEKFKDADLITLGRLGLGQALIQQGEIAEGTKLLDETMIALETEDVLPLVNGIVYCAAIETCRKVHDLERAQEWTAALTRWCEAQPDLVPFRGECLVHRAEIFQYHGEWSKALEETIDACDLLTKHRGGTSAGEAYYRQAELHRLVGNYHEAEACYREAAKRGRSPQPGLALQRLAEDRKDAAATSVMNTLKETKDPKRRTELLPAAVTILIAADQTGEALTATKELCELASNFNVPYLLAMCAYCKGAVLHAEGNIQPALEHLQKALKFWNALNLPYENAFTRELKGLVYLDLNDRDNAAAELMAAKWIYEQLGALPAAGRAGRLLKEGEGHPETHGLSLRELQVLRLVASGKTNKLVGEELFISERTVDRHVSNIFNKLGVSSRVEATTFALRHRLLDGDTH